MKKLLLMFLAVVMIMSCSTKQESKTLTVLHSGDTIIDGVSHIQMVVDTMKKDYPDITIVLNKIDLTDGSTLTMDAMIAAGIAPNVYIDTMVRAAKYLIPEYALPLNKLVRDLDKFNPGVLDAYKVNGDLLATPTTGGAQAMCINLDIMKEIGYTVPKDWTIEDFLQMAELVKQKYAGKKWATGMFAANQSGDYLINAWYASFGVKFYGKDYDTSIISDTDGAKVYEFFQKLATNGYIPPNSASLNDDDYALAWSTGSFAATAFFPSWTAGYFTSAVSQGLISAPFNYEFVPFPRTSGVTKVPTYFSGAAAIAHKTGTSMDKVAARFIEYWNSDFAQAHVIKTNVLPTRIDVPAPVDKYLSQVLDVVKDNGFQDVGITDPRFTQRRALQFPILQKVLNMKVSPAEASAEYQNKLTSVKK